MSVSVKNPSSVPSASPPSSSTPSPSSMHPSPIDASQFSHRVPISSPLSSLISAKLSVSFEKSSESSQHSTHPSFLSGSVSPHSRHPQSTSDFLDRTRPQSFCVPFGSSLPSPPSPPSSTAPMLMAHLARQRKSLPASSFSQSRTAQLALLADQAKMTATGTSSLRIARANSLFVDEAVRQAAGQADGDLAASLSAGRVGEVIVDSAWEAAFSSPGFLASASSLASDFQVQEQSRKEWAGNALALQHRRWTMIPASDNSMPAFGYRKRVSPSTEGVDPLGSVPKRRRMSFDQPALSSKERRVSFAQDSVPTTATHSGSTSADSSNSSASTSRSPQNELESALASGLSRRRSSLSSPSESRPQLLANVIASFATLLDTRQQACASLAELAKTGDGLIHRRSSPVLSPPSGLRTSSSPVTASTSLQAVGDMCAITESESESELDFETMSATSSNEGMNIKELSRTTESVSMPRGVRDPEHEEAVEPLPTEEETITVKSSGKASAMKLNRALADVKGGVEVGGCGGEEGTPAESPEEPGVSTTA